MWSLDRENTHCVLNPCLGLGLVLLGGAGVAERTEANAASLLCPSLGLRPRRLSHPQPYTPGGHHSLQAQAGKPRPREGRHLLGPSVTGIQTHVCWP